MTRSLYRHNSEGILVRNFRQCFGLTALAVTLALAGAPAFAAEPGTAADSPAPVTVVSQEEIAPLPVTALGEMLPDVASAPRRMETRTDRIIGGLTVIGRAEIERKGWRTLSQVLENVPGLHIVQAGGFGQPVSYFLRGTHSNQALVTIDGVEIHDPALDPTFGRDNVEEPCDLTEGPDYWCMTEPDEHDLPHLLTSNVERIEIIRGPSPINGPRALGGVINIVTRQGSGSLTPSAFVEVGAYGTVQQLGGVHGGNDLVNYSVEYSNLHTRGITALDPSFGAAHERDDYSNDTWSARLGLTPTEELEFTLIGRNINAKYDLDHLDLQGTQESLLREDPGQLDALFTDDGERDDRTDRARTRMLYLRGETLIKLLDNRWQQRIGVGYTDHDRQGIEDEWFLTSWLDDAGGELPASEVFGAYDRFSSDGTRIKFDWQHDLFLTDEHTLTLGAETERETIDVAVNGGSVSRQVFLWEEGRFVEELIDLGSSSQHGSVRTSALFAQHQFILNDALSGSLGARLDHHDEFGSEATWRAAAAYLFEDYGTRLHATIGTAYAEPPLRLLVGDSWQSVSIFRATTDGEVNYEERSPVGSGFDAVDQQRRKLEPEYHRGFEVGVQQEAMDGRLRMGTTYFQTWTRNLIERRSGSCDAQCQCELAGGEWMGDFCYILDDLPILDITPVPTQINGPSDSVLLSSPEFRNTGDAKTRGFESFVSYAPNDQVLMRVDHTFLTAENRATHMDLLHRPKHQVNASVEVRPLEQATVSATVRYVGRRKADVDNSLALLERVLGGGTISESEASGLRRTTLGGFTVVNLAGTYRLNERLRLVGRIDNLFNRNYQDPAHWNARGFSGYLGIQGAY